MPQASHVPDRIVHQPCWRSFIYEASYYCKYPQNSQDSEGRKVHKVFPILIVSLFLFLFGFLSHIENHWVIKRGTSNSGMEGDS